VKDDCMKTAKFSPKPTSILDATTALSVLKNVRNLQRSTKKSLSDTEYKLFYLITILFTTNLLFDLICV
jgi:hypothetical protein